MVYLNKVILIVALCQGCALYRAPEPQQLQAFNDPSLTLESNPINFYDQSMLRGQKVNQLELEAALQSSLQSTMGKSSNPTPDDWALALAAAESLYALEQLSEEALQAVYQSYSRYIAKVSSPGAALAMLETLINPQLLSDDDLLFFFNLAIEHLSLVPLRLLRDEMEKRSFDSQSANTFLAPQSQGQWMKGTVMVYLEKGYKKQGPISIPQIELGSGFFIDRAGYIITNYHVISSMVDTDYKGPAKLSVQLWDSVGERLPAQVIGYSETTDLALIKVAHRPDYVFSFDLHDQATIGEAVYALGSPGGFSFTLTKGLVSNASRQLMPIGDVIQIDAAVNPGNSGGPLVNDRGDVIGVVFAGIAQFEGLNFALPADMVRALLPKMAFKGAVKIPFLNLALYDWGNKSEITFVPNGQVVGMVGLKEGATLLSVGHRPVNGRVALQKQLLKYQANSLVKIEWSTLDKKSSAVVVLKERPKNLGSYLLRHNTLEKFYAPLFGLAVKAVTTRQYIITTVYPGGSGNQHSFNTNDSFYFVRKERTSLGDQLLAIRIQSLSRQMGIIEGGYGLLLYAPFENGAWI